MMLSNKALDCTASACKYCGRNVRLSVPSKVLRQIKQNRCRATRRTDLKHDPLGNESSWAGKV